MHGDRNYLFSRNLFPLAHVEVEAKEKNLKYKLLDSVKCIHYSVPPLRITKLEVEVAKKAKIASFKDSIDRITATQDGKQELIDFGEEKDKILQIVRVVKDFDPDIILHLVETLIFSLI